MGTSSPARLLICSTYADKNEIKWKEELTESPKASKNAQHLTLSSMWELWSSLSCSRWLCLPFTASSAAETQPGTSSLAFFSTKSWMLCYDEDCYNEAQHAGAAPLGADLRGVSALSVEPWDLIRPKAQLDLSRGEWCSAGCRPLRQRRFPARLQPHGSPAKNIFTQVSPTLPQRALSFYCHKNEHSCPPH